MLKKQFMVALAATVFSSAAFANEHEMHAAAPHDEHAAATTEEACVGFGPQTPRDIDSHKGKNKRAFGTAPSYKKMNLCNLHMHKNAEHKAKGFSIYAGDGDGHGNESGFECNISKHLSAAEMAPTPTPICKSEHGELKAGDTIEVHWVFSTADVKPGKTLGACLTDNDKNPQLRVESQVFTLVNDPKALDFNKLSYNGKVIDGYHQADAIPSNTGKPVVFAGSTTGPKYTNQACSPLQVTWSVRPMCAKVDINTVGKWCEKNVFEEDHAHGVRKLVTTPDLLSEIK